LQEELIVVQIVNMKLWNSNICLTDKKTIIVFIILLFSTLMLAAVWNNTEENIIEIEKTLSLDNDSLWVPTKEDIEYQDSMFNIVIQTQTDIDTIKEAIDAIIYKLDKLDYVDGTYDSIRYVKGGKIDKKRNQ